MSSKKHEYTASELNIPYEQNDIQLKGIFGFAIGLFLLIVITFGLMWAFLEHVKRLYEGKCRPGQSDGDERKRASSAGAACSIGARFWGRF